MLMNHDLLWLGLCQGGGRVILVGQERVNILPVGWEEEIPACAGMTV